MSGSLWPFPVPFSAWLALGTSAGEVTGGGYARQLVTMDAMANDPSGLANTTTIEWPLATSGWGTITRVTLYDAPSGGSILFTFTGNCTPLEVDAWDRPRIQAGELYSNASTAVAVTWGGVAPFGLWAFGTEPMLAATLELTFAPVMLCCPTTGSVVGYGLDGFGGAGYGQGPAWSTPGPF